MPRNALGCDRFSCFIRCAYPSPPPLIKPIRASLLVLCHTNAVIPTSLCTISSRHQQLYAPAENWKYIDSVEGLVGRALGAHWTRENHFPKYIHAQFSGYYDPASFLARSDTHRIATVLQGDGDCVIELIW